MLLLYSWRSKGRIFKDISKIIQLASGGFRELTPGTLILTSIRYLQIMGAATSDTAALETFLMTRDVIPSWISPSSPPQICWSFHPYLFHLFPLSLLSFSLPRCFQIKKKKKFLSVSPETSLEIMNSLVLPVHSFLTIAFFWVRGGGTVMSYFM